MFPTRVSLLLALLSATSVTTSVAQTTLATQIPRSDNADKTGATAVSSLQGGRCRLFARDMQRRSTTTCPRARASFEKAVQLAPAIAVGHIALGSVLLAEGDSAGAAQELETARQLGPADDSTLISLCVAYANLHQYAKSAARLP